MLIPKADRKVTYERLLADGVLVARKDTHAPKHVYLNVPNLHVMKLMQGLKSKKLVEENFSWMWHYWYLNAKGVEFLREYLHAPADVVPRTVKVPKTQGSGEARGPSRGGPRRFDGPPRPRFGDESGDKKAPGGAPAGYRPEMRRGPGGAAGAEGRFGARGGFGRGAPRAE